jgi:hypothetical protein
MKTATQTDYHATITVDCTLRKAFNAISEPDKWWTENLEGSAKNLDDIFTVRFDQTFVRFKITEMTVDRKIMWRVMDCYLHWLENKTEWINTNIFWEITPKLNETQIDMIHWGLRPGIECFEACVKGWDQYVKNSLFRLLSDGKGFPEKRK